MMVGWKFTRLVESNQILQYYSRAGRLQSFSTITDLSIAVVRSNLGENFPHIPDIRQP